MSNKEQLALDLGLPVVAATEKAPIPVRSKGFADPEIRRKAMEASFKTRQKKYHPDLPLEFDPEELKLATNGNEDDFVPTRKMLRILEVALSLEGGDSIRSWFAHIGGNRATWYLWRKIPGFERWWKTAFLTGIKQYEAQWVLIGLRNMKKDFRYWNAVGEKLYGHIQKIAVKEEKSPEETALYQELLSIFQSEKKIAMAKDITSFEDADYTVEQLEQSLESEKP